MSAKIQFPEHWKAIDLHEYFKNRKSPAAVELVTHLLKYDPIDRISAEDALKIDFL
jgi:serine/threonine protein kinase